MRLEVSFRNMRGRDEVRRRAEALFDKLQRFLDPAAEAHITVNREHGTFEVDCVVNNHGATHKQAVTDDDLRTALDKMFHGMEEQLRRAKERRIDRHRSRGEGAEAEGAEDFDEDEVVVDY
ncbi:MAG: ribosome-associated translation inhibitor RaiA [Deltaproteobacteria bacterium]|nr:MAG: ribosome-associated translation inhibitor RaiA [Deltaproteobacteria bacterium]